MGRRREFERVEREGLGLRAVRVNWREIHIRAISGTSNAKGITACRGSIHALLNTECQQLLVARFTRHIAKTHVVLLSVGAAKGLAQAAHVRVLMARHTDIVHVRRAVRRAHEASHSMPAVFANGVPKA